MAAVILRNAWVQAARAYVRDAWWQARGLAVRNPPVRRNPRSLLFVCKGNICRSPFAARAAALRLRQAGLCQVECLSAGFRVTRENTPPGSALQASRHFGVSLDGQRSTELDHELMRTADVVVVMEAAHLALLRRQYPEHRERVFLLPMFIAPPERARGYRRYSIPDPYGKSPEVFESCYGTIEKALDGMLTAMFGGTRWRRA